MEQKSTADVQANYVDETLKFIESDEVREYVRNWPEPLNKDDFVDIVLQAPATLERKIHVLKLIVNQTNTNRMYDECERWVKQLRTALNARYTYPVDATFALDDSYHRRESKMYKTFDEATNYINEQRKMQIGGSEAYDPNRYYSIAKCTPGRYGQEAYLFWILNSVGEIWYFDYLDRNIYPNYYHGILNLPVPFKPGDIIMTDCRPTEKERKVLILENHDTYESVNDDGVTCLFFTEYGGIDAGRLKTNDFLSSPVVNKISVLYRAATYTGELTEDEAPLRVISDAIKADPMLGSRIYEYLRSYKRAHIDLIHRSGEEYFGLSWKSIRKMFRLG